MLLTRALELAGESGSVRAKVGTKLSYGWFLSVKGELDAAETLFEEVRANSAELGVEPAVASALGKLAWIARVRGDHKRAEKLLREAVRMITARGDRGVLPDFQAELAATLADVGKIDEAERLAEEARANASPNDPSLAVVATTALAAVRSAQGRDAEAEELFRSALARAEETEFKVLEIEPLERYTRFLRERGRGGEAVTYASRLSVLTPPTSTERIA